MSDPAQEQKPETQPKASGGPPKPPKKIARDLFDGSGGNQRPAGQGGSPMPIALPWWLSLPKWLYRPFLFIAALLSILAILGMIAMVIALLI